MSSETEISSVSDSFRMLDGIFSENCVSFAVLALIWVVAIAAVVVLPDTIPVHWGSDSAEPDRWGSMLPGNEDESLKVLPENSGSRAFCSYIEIRSEYLSDSQYSSCSWNSVS